MATTTHDPATYDPTTQPASAIAKSEAPYNYDRFHADLYDFEDFDAPRVGERFRDAALWTLDGERVQLSDYLGDKPLVLETGSITCPMYAASAGPMQDIAARYADRLNFVLMYVREAHPGERTKAHADFEAKIAAAGRSAARHGDRRTTLVDDPDGTAHRLWGAMPNSVFVIAPDGTVIYRTMWNNPDKLDPILGEIARGQSVEADDLKPVPPFSLHATRTLLVGGWWALWDFYAGLVGLVGKHKKKGTM